MTLMDKLLAHMQQFCKDNDANLLVTHLGVAPKGSPVVSEWLFHTRVTEKDVTNWWDKSLPLHRKPITSTNPAELEQRL